MKNKTKNMMQVIYLSLICFLMGTTLACTGLPNQGVEAGNPDLTGKTVTLTLSEEREIYVLEFIDTEFVNVTKILTIEYDTQTVPFLTSSDNLIFTKALFKNGMEVEITLRLVDNEVLEVTDLVVDDQFLEASLGQETSNECLSNTTNGALQITQSLCSRIVACNTTFSCEVCESDVSTVPGLANQFGNLDGQTLAEATTQIDQGEITVEPEPLAVCLSDIAILPCAIVQENFNDSTSPNYQAVKSMIPKPSCAPGILKK